MIANQNLTVDKAVQVAVYMDVKEESRMPFQILLSDLRKYRIFVAGDGY